MKNKILVYGNCQTTSLLEVLNLPNFYTITNILCYTTQLSKPELTKIISESDIIITQAIHDNYRDVDYLSTSYILKHKKSNCKVIIFDALRFFFYNLDVGHIDNFKIPSPYHYKNMIECFKKGYNTDYYIDNFVNKANLMSSKKLEIIANDSLNELHKRYIKNIKEYGSNKNVYIVSAHDFIKENYKDKQLFYCHNHPTKDVLQFVGERIIELLRLPYTINYTIDPLWYTQPIIYRCVQKAVNFKIENESTLIDGIKYSIQDVIQLYYNTYSKHGLPVWPK